jgi:hypothetical protein
MPEKPLTHLDAVRQLADKEEEQKQEFLRQLGAMQGATKGLLARLEAMQAATEGLQGSFERFAAESKEKP